MPTLRQLEYLVAVADTLHFHRAAAKVHASQPTLSSQLKVLENRLGVELVERSRRRVVLTPLGTEVAAIARRALRDVAEIRNLISANRGELSGIIRLGLPATKGPWFLPRVIPDLHRTFPNLKLHVREDLPRSLVNDLQEGVHDVIIVPIPVTGPQLQSVAIYREPLYVAVSTDHPFARTNRIRRSALKGQSVLVLGPGHQLHELAIALCRELGAKVLLDYEGTSLDTLREMVGMGLGITFLPGLYVRTALAAHPHIKVLELQGRPIHRTIGLVWRKASVRHSNYRRLGLLFSEVIRRDFSDFAPRSR